MSGSDNQADNRKYAGEKASSDISGLWKQNFNRLHASRDRKICYGLSKRKTKMKENSNSCEKTLEVIIKNQKTNMSSRGRWGLLAGWRTTGANRKAVGSLDST